MTVARSRDRRRPGLSCGCWEDGLQATLAVEGVRWFHHELASENRSAYGTASTHQALPLRGMFLSHEKDVSPLPESAAHVLTQPRVCCLQNKTLDAPSRTPRVYVARCGRPGSTRLVLLFPATDFTLAARLSPFRLPHDITRPSQDRPARKKGGPISRLLPICQLLTVGPDSPIHPGSQTLRGSPTRRSS